ncbi:MAG: pilus assembly protein [Aquisalinus sp.]|nr:pilus assembly protein [Aquisalinus sp.]
MRELIRKFLRETGGNFVMIVALASPVLMLLSAGAMDMARYRGSVDELQNIVDFAAIAGAREMVLANSDQASIHTTVNNVITSRMTSKFGGQSYSKNIDVRMDDGEVYVFLSIQVNGMLGQNLFPDNGLIKADSTAIATSSTKICAISLDGNDPHTFMFKDQAELKAAGCSLYANSYSPNAVQLDANVKVDADLLCSSGGAEDQSRKKLVTIITDCPVITDPLKDREPPGFSAGCDEVDFSIGRKEDDEGDDRDGDDNSGGDLISAISDLVFEEQVTLRPGVYCGGIHIGKHVELKFDPGIYIIKDGPFIVEKHSSVKGEGVGFYFTGDNSRFEFEKNSAVNFAAPETGDMAGILFMEDASKLHVEEFNIFTHLADELLGTIYLPMGKLTIDTERSVGADSAFTVILAKEIHLVGKPSLYLNTDYNATSVPVPEGVGPIGGSTYLKN